MKAEGDRMKYFLFIMLGFVVFHFIMGLLGVDFGTFECLRFFFGNSKALDIWWADWFDGFYVLSHVIIIVILIGVLYKSIPR